MTGNRKRTIACHVDYGLVDGDADDEQLPVVEFHLLCYIEEVKEVVFHITLQGLI